MTREDLAKPFPAGYWNKWESEFGHNFFDAHAPRTVEYDHDFIEPELSGKSVLEIGGFPGLLASVYIARGCKVVAIDSPNYRPEYYLKFAESQLFQSIPHDINSGAPPLEEHYDVAVMSDVLLHNDGFPSEFMKWVIAHCDKLYLLNYPEGGDKIMPAGQHNLKVGFPVPSVDAIIEEMARLGAKIARPNRETGGRTLLTFERNYEIPLRNTPLRKQRAPRKTVPKSGAPPAEG